MICTELHRLGYIPNSWYEADSEIGKEQNFSTMVGYHFWAKPLVRLMRKSSIIFNSVTPLGIELAKYMAYLKGSSDKYTSLGKKLHEIGAPFCKKLGTWLVMNGHVRDEIDEDALKKIVLNNLKFSEEVETEPMDKVNSKLDSFFDQIRQSVVIENKISKNVLS